jgi:hypothetical protein
MRLIHLGMTFALAAGCLLADTVTLKSGRVINGTYLGGTARTVRVDMGDRIETLDVSDVARIEFSGPPANAPAPRESGSDRPSVRRPENPPAGDPDRPVLRRSAGSGEGGGILRPDPSDTGSSRTANTASVELPAGTNLVVRMIDGVDSDAAHVGQTFSASIDEPVRNSAGETVIPRGADVVVKLVDSKESGKLTGRAELTLDLVSVKVNGRVVDVNTQTVSRESNSRGEKTAKVAGGTAAVGAIIGAIAGGGKGAAVGAAAGGAAGAGAQVITKGERVRIPSETRLTFVLDNPVTI